MYHRKIVYVGRCLKLAMVAATLLSVTSYCQSSKEDSGIPLPYFRAGCSELMAGLHKEWSLSDGEAAFVVARKMMWAMLLDPNSFYQEFSPDTIYYNRFASNLYGLVFWNPVDSSTEHLENLRVVAIERLEEQSYAIDEKFLDVHQEMIETLRNLRVTHVD